MVKEIQLRPDQYTVRPSNPNDGDKVRPQKYTKVYDNERMHAPEGDYSSVNDPHVDTSNPYNEAVVKKAKNIFKPIRKGAGSAATWLQKSSGTGFTALTGLVRGIFNGKYPNLWTWGSIGGGALALISTIKSGLKTLKLFYNKQKESIPWPGYALKTAIMGFLTTTLWAPVLGLRSSAAKVVDNVLKIDPQLVGGGLIAAIGINLYLAVAKGQSFINKIFGIFGMGDDLKNVVRSPLDGFSWMVKNNPDGQQQAGAGNPAQQQAALANR